MIDPICPDHDLEYNEEEGCPGCLYEYQEWDRKVDRDD
jgi:hypothetical protein